LTPQRALVRVKLDCSSGSTGKVITGVDASKITLGPLAVAGTMDPKTGDVPVPTSTSAMSFTWSSSALNATMITSEPLTVLPRLASSASPLTLSIARDAIALDGVSKQEAATITLPHVALAAGKSYTLTLTPKMERKFLRWAGSNIYWDGSKLTFKEHGVHCDNGEEMYQGVFFRWGSLVGIDPCKSSSTTNWHSSNTLYSPVYNGNDPTNSTWDPLTDQTWSETYPASSYSSGANGGPDADFFATYNPNNYSNSNKEGDICRYLSHTGVVSGKYRMPTAYELRYGSNNSSTPTVVFEASTFSGTTPVVGYWTTVAGSTWTNLAGETDPTGKYVLPSGGNYSGYAQFPAAGCRSNGGAVDTYRYVGTVGYYWSSSDSKESSGSAYRMSFSNSSLGAGYTNGWETGSVRCLLDE
jgi:hypothetical protein